MNQKIVIQICNYIISTCVIEKLYLQNNEINITVKPSIIFNTLLFLKFHMLCQFKILSCISALDYPLNKYRFKLCYDLLSIKYNYRLRVKTFCHELLEIESCVLLFLTGGWYESEIWDMFGIFFNNHPFLKRILTDYGFEGHPLRKDFPLSGFVEMKYNNVQKRVLNESIQIDQEFRTFKFLSPWV